MPREKEKFWDYVTFLNEKKTKWRCNFCVQEYGGGATRIKAHFAGIARFGIKACERVDDHVKAEANDVLLKSSDRGGSEERIPRNVRAAPTSTSNPSNMEGRINLQYPQGVPTLIPQTREGLEEMMVQRERTVNIANLTMNEYAQQNPGWDLIDNTFQNEPQGSILPGPIASGTQFDHVVATDTLPHSHQEDQSFLGPCGHRTGLSPPWVPMDIINTMGPSTSQASVLPQRQFSTTEPQSLDMLPQDSPSSPTFSEFLAGVLREPDETTDMANFTSDQVGEFHQTSAMLSLAPNRHGESVPRPMMVLAEAEPRSHLPDLPDQPQNIIRSPMQMNDQQTPAGPSSFQYDHLSDHTSGFHISKEPNLDLQVPAATINAIGPSPSQGVPPLAPQSRERMEEMMQEERLVDMADPALDATQLINVAATNTPLLASQHTSGSHISETPNLDLRVLDAVTNAMGPSSSLASVLHRRPSVPQPSINHETMNAPQNPTVPSSSCNSVTSLPATLVELDPHMLPSSQAPDNAPPFPQIITYGTDMTTGAPMMSHPDTAKNSEKIGVLKRKLERLYRRQAEIKGELDHAGSLSLKKPRKEVSNWLADVDKLINDFPCTESVREDRLPLGQVDVVMQDAEELVRRDNFPHGLCESTDIKFSKFLEKMMVGEAFQRNTTKILEYLIENQVSRLGIYGMGGVGKTTIMKYTHNRLLEKANYGNVFWVTVSQDFNPVKLQDDIWKALNLGTLKEKDLDKRAAMLSDCLTNRGNSTIILDDVWEHFDLEEVGIPIRVDGLRLVLTTRYLDVCRKMECKEKIKIEPLSQEEAEFLFFEVLGSEVALNLETKVVAKSVITECAGLPLGVITMARSMRGVTDVFEWKDCLLKLKQSDMEATDMERRVLMNLEFSYNRLGDNKVQQCFLSCALYPEDKLINELDLIEFFIDQGLFDGVDTRESQYDRGFTMLNKLEDACLLEADGEKRKMHDLIRDMALHVIRATSIVKAGKRLTKIPLEECWTKALEKVSLMDNQIEEFPLDMSPNCPKLSIILLRNSLSDDVVIPKSFFKYLRQLTVLNLSFCSLTELPSSISVLVNLRALLLRYCRGLRHIPHLGKLRSLRKLDVANCYDLEALSGLEMLVNLRYLDIRGTKILILPKGKLGVLKNLQWFLVFSVHVEDFANVRPLERFAGNFKCANDFNKFVRVTRQKNNPRYYYLGAYGDSFYVTVNNDARFGSGRLVEINGMRDAIMSMKGEELTLILGKRTDDYILIPHDVQNLSCRKDDCIIDLSGMYPLENLESLRIGEWEKLRVLCGGADEDVIGGHDSRVPTTAPLLFPSFPILVELTIDRCPNLKYLFGHGSIIDLPHLKFIRLIDCPEMLGITVATAPPPSHSSPAFRSLTVITVFKCHKMKRVVEPEWLPHLPKLSCIKVSYCDEMEELIGIPPPYTPVEDMSFECIPAPDSYDMRRPFEDELRANVRDWADMKFFHVQVEQGQEGSINNAPSSSQSSISLPNLKYLWLYDMARLKSICKAPIFYDTVNVLAVRKCPGLPFATAVTR